MCQEIDEESPGFDDFLRDVCKRMGEQARKDAFSHGLPVIFMRDGVIIRQYSDGREEIWKDKPMGDGSGLENRRA